MAVFFVKQMYKFTFSDKTNIILFIFSNDAAISGILATCQSFWFVLCKLKNVEPSNDTRESCYPLEIFRHVIW